MLEEEEEDDTEPTDSSSEKLEGSQKTLILPTGAGRARNRFPAQLYSHAGNG